MLHSTSCFCWYLVGRCFYKQQGLMFCLNKIDYHWSTFYCTLLGIQVHLFYTVNTFTVFYMTFIFCLLSFMLPRTYFMFYNTCFILSFHDWKSGGNLKKKTLTILLFFSPKHWEPPQRCPWSYFFICRIYLLVFIFHLFCFIFPNSSFIFLLSCFIFQASLFIFVILYLPC